jgi:hypothetical protein
LQLEKGVGTVTDAPVKRSSSSKHRRFQLVMPLLIIFSILAITPAEASNQTIDFAQCTSTVKAPSVTLGVGNQSTTSVSATNDYATITTTAGLAFYENASGPSGPTPSANTALTPSGSSGSYAVNQGTTAYLWSPQFGSATTIGAGSWVLGLWTASPSYLVGYVPITLTNSQSTAVSGGTQVMINMSWNNYTSYLDNPVDNYVFFNSSGTPLYSWLENGTSSSSTNSVVWVKLDSNGIPANGAVTIYVGFYPHGTNVLGWNNATGASALLAGNYGVNYGLYDNGNLTFTFYDNFNGRSLSSNWNISTYGSPTITVNNGLNVTTAKTSATGYNESCIYASFTPPSAGMIMEVNWRPVAGTFSKFGMGNNLTGSSMFNNINGYLVRPNWNANTSLLQCFKPPVNYTAIATLTESNNYVLGNNYTMGLTWSTVASNNMIINDTTTGKSASVTDKTFNPLNGTQIALDAAGQETFWWVRVRQALPNNVMPTVSNGSMTIPTNALLVSVYVTNSSGSITSTIASNQSLVIGSTESPYPMTFAGGQVPVPANGYLMVSLSAGIYASYVVYWGTGQATNFSTPSIFNYVLSLNNSGTVPYNVNISVFSSSLITRLTNLTLYLNSTINGIAITNGVFTQSSSTFTLPANSTLQVAVNAMANAFGSSNIMLLLKITQNVRPFAYNAINLTVN